VGLTRGEQSTEIAASPEVCFEAIVDYDSFPAWQHAVEEVEVVELGGDGLAKLVEFDVDAKFRRVTYRLRYHYDRPGRVSWDFVEGHGVEHVDGEYLFEPAGEHTLATYKLGIDAGIPIPGLIARRLNDQVMKRSVEDLKREAERRAGSA
jgi:carbon monoxide dehydrogenase subunit G